MEAAFARTYERANVISSMKEHCLQGLFEAVNNLCDWTKIDQLVKKHANGSLNNIWNDAWRDWILPYACNAYIHMWVEKRWTSKSDDLEVIQSWICDTNKLEHLKPILGEDLVMFLLSNQNTETLRNTAELLNDLVDKTGKQWVTLNPLCTELGIRKLQKLQIMNDLDVLLKVFRCTNETDYLDGMITLLNFWSTKSPTIRDNLTYWHKLADYRRKSAELFERRLHNSISSNMLQKEEWRTSDDEVNRRRKRAIRNRMRRIDIQLRLDIADAALHQKHRYIAENHLKCLQSIPCLPDASLKTQITLLEAKIECLRADIDIGAHMKMTNYTASWKRLHQLLNENDDLDIDMNTTIRKHIGTLALKIESLIEESSENQGFMNMLANNNTILHDIGIMEVMKIDLNEIKEKLLQYTLNNLSFCEHAATNTISNIGEYYYVLAKHYYIKLTNSNMQSEEIFRKFLLFTLKSMYHDYLEATHYFPCLLQPDQLQNEQTREIFIQECAKLQPWLFLRWQNLLFLHLATPSIATTVAPIVEKLIDIYPDAIVYTYYLTIERNPNILQNINIQRIHFLLRDKTAEYKKFLQAIQYVAQPELYLKYYLNEVAKELSFGKTTAIELLLEKIHSIFNTQTTCSIRPGDIYKLVAIYEKEIRALDINNHDAARERIQKIRNSLDKSLEKSVKNRKEKIDKNKNKLKYYSPFLNEYTGGGIEVPGQYTGDKKPMLCYHAKIARFEPEVIVMQSLRKPIRIGIIGDNGKEYRFLVKFGEDLTIDHGLQQLYATMNRTLRNNTNCRQRRLIINTYEVFKYNLIIACIFFYIYKVHVNVK